MNTTKEIDDAKLHDRYALKEYRRLCLQLEATVAMFRSANAKLADSVKDLTERLEQSERSQQRHFDQSVTAFDRPDASDVRF